MWWMVRIEVEILASVGRFSVDFVSIVISFLMTKTAKKGIALS
jgi:hypothetical protein